MLSMKESRMYTIKELADLAGTTPRALRYYQQLQLLEPALIGENGYRYYDRENLLTLQQILFFRELALPLKEIQFIFSRPDFQLLPALHNHQQALLEKIARLEALLDTVASTIQDLEGELTMSDQDLFQGFDEKNYQEEAERLWGDSPQYTESIQKWSSYSSDRKDEIKRQGGEITRSMVGNAPGISPADPSVQQAVEDYYHYLNRYFYSCDVEFLRGLADMWVQDPRFAVNYERVRQGGAEFVREAVHVFCDRHRAER